MMDRTVPDNGLAILLPGKEAMRLVGVYGVWSILIGPYTATSTIARSIYVRLYFPIHAMSDTLYVRGGKSLPMLDSLSRGLCGNLAHVISNQGKSLCYFPGVVPARDLKDQG